MNTIKKFELRKNYFIEILIPNFKEKYNYYYKPNEKLHMFDEVKVILKIKDKKYILKVDVLDFVVHKFKNLLRKALSNLLQLPNDIEIGNLGFYYNDQYYNENYDALDFSNFWLFSGKNIQTWLYNRNDKIYLEIAPSYPWLFSDQKDADDYVPFDEFVKTYQPITIEEIDHVIVQKWIDQCDEILNTMITV